MMSDEKLRETEVMLREAAAWEPEHAAPEQLTQLALAVALRKQAEVVPRRPSASALLLTLVLGGGATAAALSGTLLMVMSPRSDLPIVLLQTPKATLTGYLDEPYKAAAAVPTTPAPAAPRLARKTPARVFRGSRARTAAATVSLRRPAPRAIWTTEEVVQRQEGLLAPGVVVEPDVQNGVVHLLPAIVNIPVTPGTSACAPTVEPHSEALLPPPPGFPEFEAGLNQEIPR